MVDQKTYYQLLGVPASAPVKEIKRAYHNWARKLHPDKARSPDEAKEFEEQFALITKAYNVLKDSGKRGAYDKQINAQALKEAAETRVEGPPRKTTTAETTPERAHLAQRAYARGLEYLKHGQYSRAVDFFQAAVDNNPEEANYYAHLAIALIKAKKSFNRALELCDRAVKLQPYNLDFKFIQAEIYETTGSTSLALKVYQEILRWDKDNQLVQNRIVQLSKAGQTRPWYGRLLKLFRK